MNSREESGLVDSVVYEVECVEVVYEWLLKDFSLGYLLPGYLKSSTFTAAKNESQPNVLQCSLELQVRMESDKLVVLLFLHMKECGGHNTEFNLKCSTEVTYGTRELPSSQSVYHSSHAGESGLEIWRNHLVPKKETDDQLYITVKLRVPSKMKSTTKKVSKTSTKVKQEASFPVPLPGLRDGQEFVRAVHGLHVPIIRQQSAYNAPRAAPYQRKELSKQSG